MLSKPETLPLILQARVKKAWKTGTLALSPLGWLVDDNTENRLLLSQKSPIHCSMMKHVEIAVTQVTDRRGAKIAEKEKPIINNFLVMSPAMNYKKPAQRTSCLENLSPFWAVLGCVGQRATYNMELQIMSFRDNPYDVHSGGNFPKLPPGVHLEVRLPVLRNCSNVAAGEVLCMAPLDA
jgi:hypothetical protein